MRILCLKLVLLAVVGLAPAAVNADSARESDPLERINRPIFTFNDALDRWFLAPVARGWNRVVPEPAQDAITRFFHNIDTPTVVVNNVLQGKPRQAAIDLTRFAFNTTFGVLGFFDPSAAWGLPRSEEDFGQTLGVWGVPPGPYLMLPVFGPYTVRDGAGIGVDWVTAVYPYFAATQHTIGASVVDTVNWRSQSLDSIDQLRESSVDFYAAVRNGFLQRRQAQVDDRRDVDAGEEEDLYFFDEEDEEE